MFAVNANSTLFHDACKMELGIEESPEAGYLIGVEDEGDGEVLVFLYDYQGNSAVNSSNYSTFLTTDNNNNNNIEYGNVVFTFQDVSEIEIPSGS